MCCFLGIYGGFLVGAITCGRLLHWIFYLFVGNKRGNNNMGV